MSDPTKWQFHHLPAWTLPAICECLQEGNDKWGFFNWRVQPSTLFFDALVRHLVAYKSDEQYDPKTGRSHLAYMAANAIILLAKEMDDESKPPES